jgi:hypothetical protein
MAEQQAALCPRSIFKLKDKRTPNHAHFVNWVNGQLDGLHSSSETDPGKRSS